MRPYQALVVLVQLIYNTQLGLNSTKFVSVERLIQMPTSINVVAVHHRRGECVARRASSDMVILALVFVAMPSVGCIIAYVCEHTQRESVRDRGAIQAWYLIFRRFVSTVTSVLSFLALGAGSEPNMSDVYSLNTAMKIRSQILRKINDLASAA
ncbi:hypothetical protein PF005_g17702 [Phytophthora fragariae]|uniref:Uncharacterized protein n=1 Tax=Phytophthora fragariae TaxID=53985 RepID=A0A6A3X1A6_9STRA|nr:hypothetical protein PF011_g15955 [Phytophthora fragariae]KAE9190245.1 hypothetical protein PF002_g24822 [Phytophthora fragariae]KAE9194390.1 hypothetical protein PF005_g17702 [Phytophthora fragariae]